MQSARTPWRLYRERPDRDRRTHDRLFSDLGIAQERWKNNSLSADFMADYFATFYALHGSDEEGRLAYVKGAVSFVANELIENAMKFTDVDGIPISIRLTMHEGELVFFASNGASIAGSQNYEAAVKRLLNADPWAAYERRAHADDNTLRAGTDLDADRLFGPPRLAIHTV